MPNLHLAILKMAFNICQSDILDMQIILIILSNAEI